MSVFLWRRTAVYYAPWTDHLKRWVGVDRTPLSPQSEKDIQKQPDWARGRYEGRMS